MNAHTSLVEAREIVTAMPAQHVRKLRSILTVRMATRTRQAIILRSGLPLGAAVVAQAYDDLLPVYRRAA